MTRRTPSGRTPAGPTATSRWPTTTPRAATQADSRRGRSRTAPPRRPSAPTPAYIEAINGRDGETICELLPRGAEPALKPPVRSGDCPRRLGGSIGYRDPRGFPVWKRTTLTGIEGTNVSRNLDSARLTASIVTEFDDRSEPSVEKRHRLPRAQRR